MKASDIDSIMKGIAPGLAAFVAKSAEAVGSRVDALAKRIDEREDAIRADTTKALADAVAALPVPKDGADGVPGEKGADGLAGRDGVDGIAGEKGEPGTAGRDGIDGKDANPIDYEKLAALVETEVQKRMLDFERRAQDILIRAVQNIPAPAAGIDGKNGFELDDFDAQMSEDGAEVVLKFARADRPVIEKRLPINRTRYEGVYVDGREYGKGAMVTWAGSVWHANTATSEKPGDGQKSWTLAVKRGNDGKHATTPAPAPHTVKL